MNFATDLTVTNRCQITPTRLSTAHCAPNVCKTSHRLLPLDTVSDTVKFPRLGTAALIHPLPRIIDPDFA